MKPIFAGVLLTLAAACSGSERRPIGTDGSPEELTEQQLQSLSTERIWDLCSRRFGVRPPENPTSKDWAIEIFLHAQKCARGDCPTAPPKDRAPYAWTNSEEELDILEAVFRYQFENNPITMDGESLDHLDCLFVALGRSGDWTDPPARLVDRFADHLPPVEAVSASEYVGSKLVTHKSRGGGGRIFSVERIRRIDADTVDVDGRYSGGCDSESSYRVRRRSDSWVVVGDAMWWIS